MTTSTDTPATVMLAALVGHYHFSAAELEGLTASRARFWLDALKQLRDATKP
jgi:hypothetical protein